MKIVMRLAGLIFLATLAAGCRREEPTSPAAAYRGFIEAVQKGNTKKAWAALSPSTRERVEARSKAIAAASGGAVRDEPQVLLFQGTRPAPLGEVTQLKADDTTALIQVASAGGPREVKLVKDSGRWLVDLTDAINRVETP